MGKVRNSLTPEAVLSLVEETVASCNSYKNRRNRNSTLIMAACIAAIAVFDLSVTDHGISALIGYQSKMAGKMAESATFAETRAEETGTGEETSGALGIITITATTLNIRNSPNGEIIGTAAKGETYEYFALENNWYQIIYDGQTGYVFGDYAKEAEGGSGNGNH